jgi:hypothetical protein
MEEVTIISSPPSTLEFFAVTTNQLLKLELKSFKVILNQTSRNKYRLSQCGLLGYITM